MTTKSITQGRPVRRRADLNAYTGKPDIVDEHPLVTCAPHIMSGHAHLKTSKVTVERVLLALLHERDPEPLVMTTGLKLSDEEVRAAVRYAVDIFENISKLYAELGRLRAMVPKGEQQ